MAGLYGVVVDLVDKRVTEDTASWSIDTRPLIEVRNGCGEAGLAARIKARLLDRGFDVIHTGNADDFSYGKSILIDLKGNRAGLRDVQEALGCRAAILQKEPDAIADYALIVGRDYREIRWLK